MILTKIPQRIKNDCSICSVAMALGLEYEQVELARRVNYAHSPDNESWWEYYFRDLGLVFTYIHQRNLEDVVMRSGSVAAGLLVMHNHRLQAAHIVAIDERGVLDPSDGFPEVMAWPHYRNFKTQLFEFEEEILAVVPRNSASNPRADQMHFRMHFRNFLQEGLSKTCAFAAAMAEMRKTCPSFQPELFEKFWEA